MSIYTSAEGARAIEQRYREFLAHWPVPHKHLHIDTRAGETFVVVCGPREAPPLVLLHGSMGNTTTWMGDVPAWSQHFRVYAVDMIGEPGLSAPSRPDLASEAYALWLDDVLRALDVEQVSVVGMSLGGWLALDYAIRRPGRVARMALLCPGGIGRQKWGVLLAVLLLRPFGRRGGSAAIRLVLGTAPPQTAEAQGFADYMMLVNRHFRPRMGTLPVFSDDALRQLTTPMLVIVGGRDRLMDSHATRQRLERTAPCAQVHLLSDVGHLLLEQTLPILDFLCASGEHTPGDWGAGGINTGHTP